MPEVPAGPLTANESAAQELRENATDKNVALWPEDSERTAVEVSLSPKDKGLTYLAKRAYVDLGYPTKPVDKAKDAAIMLSALFVEKMGADPKLGNTAVLRITKGGAELIRDIEPTHEKVEFAGGAEEPVRLTVEPTVGSVESTEKAEEGHVLVYDSNDHSGFRSFMTSFYKNQGYDDASAARASSILYGLFMEHSNGKVPAMQNGDKLNIKSDMAIFTPVSGKEWTVDLSDEEAILKEYKAAKKIVLDTSHMRQDHVFDETADAMEAWSGALKNQLIGAIPDIVVSPQPPMLGGRVETCRVLVGRHYYSVLQSQNGKYRVFSLEGPNDALTFADPKTDWTDDFEEVKNAIV